MSVQAMSWALTQQVVTDSHTRHVLLCLANYADQSGRAAFPAVSSLALDTGLAPRTVQYRLRELESIGLIKRGNQAIAAAYITQRDRVPVCYDIDISRGAQDAPRTERGAPEDATGCTPEQNGVHTTTERGAPGAPNPPINHPLTILNQKEGTNLQAESVNSALIGSGVTPRFADSTFATYRGTTTAMAQALETCQAYADNFGEHFQAGRNLLLCGNVGNGKTHLASGIVQHVIRHHRAVAVITTAAEIIRVFKRSMARDAGFTEGDVINELASYDLLVIDEVGAQAGTHYELSVLHEVLDRRYNLIRPTVVVSNLNAQGLSQYIGERALDRLRENKALLVGFTWESARGRV